MQRDVSEDEALASRTRGNGQPGKRAKQSQFCRLGVDSGIPSLGIRYGFRQLLRNPGFTVVAVLTLALGIGANTAIFTLVYGVMLKQLPVSHPGQLYRVGEGENYCCEWGGLQNSWGTFDYPFYKQLRDHDGSFDQLAAFSGGNPTFSIRLPQSSQAAQTIDGEYVSGNYFSTLGIDASSGRLVTPFDDNENSAPVAVVGYRAWQNQFASDPSIVGRKVLINELPFTIIGVAAPGFNGDRLTQSPPSLWVPLSQEPILEGNGRKSLLYSSGDAWLYVIGRLNAGQAPKAVESKLTGELQQYLRAQRDLAQDEVAKVNQEHIRLSQAGTGVSSLRNNSKRGLLLLSSAAGLVLFIACANLANLLLVRGAARSNQIALCLSLGAPRIRLMRAILIESLLMSLMGGAIGVLLAFSLVKALLLIVFRGATLIPVSAAPSIPVLCFAFLLSLLTCVAFSLVPAWIGTHADPRQGLQSVNRSRSSYTSHSQKFLVAFQAAVSLVLLAVAGLATESLIHLERADLGFHPEGRVLAWINFKAAGYKPEDLPALYNRIQDKLENIPGVLSASLSLNAPQKFCCINLNIAIAGRAEDWIGDVDTNFNRVAPNYFQTIGTPLAMGRSFSRSDTQNAPHVAVVDENFVQKFLGSRNPIGQHFGLNLEGHSTDFEIVGVAKNTTYRNPASPLNPTYFLPFSQTTAYAPAGYQRLEAGTLYAQVIEMKVAGAPASYSETLRKALMEVDPKLALIDVDTYSDQVALQFNQERLIARLTSLFGVLALLLASVGLYGVTAYNVARRTAEIGIRMALGADRGNVMGMVLKGAMKFTGIGLCVGVPIAIFCGKLLHKQLYEVNEVDPKILCATVLVLALCSLLAAFLPAKRAASIDPNRALRTE